jgi:hypothetical protein
MRNIGNLREKKGKKINDNILGSVYYRLKKEQPGQAPVAHVCNPSYLEGRDQEDQDLNPALGK